MIRWLSLLLNYSPGGSGRNILYIAVMAYRHHQLVNIATQYIGDRVRVKGAGDQKPSK